MSPRAESRGHIATPFTSRQAELVEALKSSPDISEQIAPTIEAINRFADALNRYQGRGLEDMVTEDQLIQKWQISKNHLRTLLKSLKVQKLGRLRRYRASDIQSFLDKNYIKQ